MGVGELCNELIWLDYWVEQHSSRAADGRTPGIDALAKAIATTRAYLGGSRRDPSLLPDGGLSVARAWMDATVTLKTTDREAAARCYQVSLYFAKVPNLSVNERSTILAQWNQRQSDPDPT